MKLKSFICLVVALTVVFGISQVNASPYAASVVGFSQGIAADPNYDNPNVFRGFDGHIIISSEAQEIYIREFGSEEEQNLRIVDVLELKEIKEKRKNTKKIKTKKRK